MPTSRILFGFAVAVGLFYTSFLNAQKKEEPPKGKILLFTGVDKFHDWRANSATLRKILEDDGLAVTLTEEPWTLATEGMKEYDGIVMVYNRDERWPAPVEEALVKLIRGGMGIAIIHSSDNSSPGWKEFEDMVGLLWRTNAEPKAGHDHFGPLTVKITDKQHFVTSGTEDFSTMDELYRDLTKYSDFQTLAQAFSKDKQRDYPMIMVKTYGHGRVFHTVLGHSPESMKAMGFQRTTVRGVLWAIKKDK